MSLSKFVAGKTGFRHLNAFVDALDALFAARALKSPSTTVAIANTGTPDGVAHVTGQVKDAAGNNLAGRFLVTVYIGSAAYGAPVDLGTATALANSTILKADTADALLRVLTHSDGSWGVELDLVADGTTHAHAAVSGTFATANVAVTGN